MMMLYTSDEEFAKDDNNDTPHFDLGLFDDAAQMVYDEGGFDAAQLTDPRAQKVIEETARIINRAIDTAVPHEVPETLRYALENNGFIFSGLKAFHALREVGLSMLDDKGNVKPFEDFRKDVQQINQNYNVNWLNAEYKHALGSSLMAVKWDDLKQDTDRYFLQYRTAQDSRVRPDHAALDGITLPADDPFWSKYYPPNGWGCRCQAVQVRRSKYQPSDPKEAMKLGDEATATNKQQMFRYNAGMDLNLFPPKHPYYKTPPAVKQTVDGYTPVEWTPKTVKEAEQFYSDKLGVNCALDGFTKKDMKQIEDIFRSVERHFQCWPELKKETLFVGTIRGRIKLLTEAKFNEYKRDFPKYDDEVLMKWAKSWAKKVGSCRNCYAYSHGAAKDMGLSGICFNTTWKGEKIDTSLQSDVKAKWHPVGCDTLKSVFDHELGHEIDRLLGVRSNADFLKLYGEEKAKGKQSVKESLSDYANKNSAEFIAEAWSEYLNNEKPRPIAAAVYMLVKKLYAEKSHSSTNS